MDNQGYASSWYAATAIASPERPPLTFAIDVDVCVVGAGFAGLTVAREIARRGWSVAVLEAQRVAWGASGRNLGFVLPGFTLPPDKITARVGPERSKRLTELSVDGVEYVRRTIEDTQTAGVDPVPGWLYISKTDDRKELANFAALSEQFGVPIESWSVEQVRAELRSNHYFGAVHFPTAFSVHPLNYALGLAAAAEQAGARIYEQTPALTIDAAGIRKRIDTPGGRVRASHIVLAGSAYLGEVLPDIARTVLPITTYVAVTAPLGARLHEVIRYQGAVTDTVKADNHYRIVDGDRLLWSGRSSAWDAAASRHVKGLRKDLRTTFRQLGDVQFEHVWPGMMAFAVHRMPQIGRISPGLWIASAFGGHGFNTTAMAGQLIARAVVDGDDSWQLFSPYELIWAGGTLGRLASQLNYWTSRTRERMAGWVARRHYAPPAAPVADLPAVQAPPAVAAETTSPVAAESTLLQPVNAEVAVVGEPAAPAVQQPSKQLSKEPPHTTRALGSKKTASSTSKSKRSRKSSRQRRSKGVPDQQNKNLGDTPA